MLRNLGRLWSSRQKGGTGSMATHDSDWDLVDLEKSGDGRFEEPVVVMGSDDEGILSLEEKEVSGSDQVASEEAAAEAGISSAVTSGLPASRSWSPPALDDRKSPVSSPFESGSPARLRHRGPWLFPAEEAAGRSHSEGPAQTAVELQEDESEGEICDLFSCWPKGCRF